jgi:ribosomal protein S18 acetylase RimI-like enzyme
LVEPASLSLARAFADDPSTAYFVPDAGKRGNLNYSFEYYLQLALLSKGYEAYVTSPECEAVAVWVGPDAADHLLTQFRAGWPFLPLRLGWRSLWREAASDARFSRLRGKLVPGRHMYLALLGVDPGHRDKGLASRLVRPMLERLDREALPAYVETQNRRNADMYSHWGFRLLRTEKLPKSDIDMYLLLREPGVR